ncbi:MAG: acetate--CoA ligase family protein [Nanoarchaeota archaeon]|nr:acetate--CoA ligase family protein [Nanoarchaeota archaeon]
MLSLSNSLRFMKTRGFNVVRFYECKNKNEFLSAFDKLDKPIVMKIDSEKYTHKTEVSGVVMNITDKREALMQFNRLMLLGESVVVQEQLKGVELILGVTNDTSFGTLIMFGMGGVFVELLQDVSFRACPINLQDAEEMINDLKMKELLNGFRNQPKVNKTLLKRLLVKLSKFAVENKVLTLDLNPIIFDKNNYYIVDARMDTLTNTEH